MPLYFLVHDADTYHRLIVPALAAGWRQRRFLPCQPLREALLPAARAFAERYHIDLAQSVLDRLSRGLAFDRDIWRLLVGEVLLFGAAAVPEIETAPETLSCLLAPGSAPIRQAHFGSRDLVFGSAFYRPDQAGLNDRDDVARLADDLTAIDPAMWKPEDLAAQRGLNTEEERAEELEFVREWFPVLRKLYQEAREANQVIICEMVQATGPD